MPSNPYADNFQSGGYFYNAIQRDVAMVKGDVMAFGFQVQGLGPTDRPEEIKFICKEAVNDENALFVVDLNGSIDFVSYDSEHDILTYSVRIPPNLTAGLEVGRYFYLLNMKVNGDVFTLLKGRLLLDYNLTGDAITPGYDDGDNVNYPAENIPTGSKKVYTEQTISNIASAINQITGDTSDEMTTGGMVETLGGVRTTLDTLSNTINAMLNTPEGEEIPLDNMSAQVSSIRRGLYTRQMIVLRTTYEEV